jgi:hypothetical protein
VVFIPDVNFFGGGTGATEDLDDTDPVLGGET